MCSVLQGFKCVEKWSTDNTIYTDLTIEDKLVQGLKTTFASSFNPSTGKKKGTIKNSYKQDYVNANLDVDLEHVAVAKGSLVLGYVPVYRTG